MTRAEADLALEALEHLEVLRSQLTRTLKLIGEHLAGPAGELRAVHPVARGDAGR